RAGARSARRLTRVIAFVGMGSNLVHPRRQLARATRRLARLPRTALLAVSCNFVTAPLGTRDAQPDYVNAVAMLATALSPRALLARLNALERRQGRRRGANSPRNAARSLDLDLLLYGRLRLDTRTLTLPHPRMHERAFVLRPLADVAPAATIPGHGLARRHFARVRGQRVARTRTHHLH
ncbi:MAG: 2-amino-4-hydroxy-6-hydroxymethyldihydropteridine diphosphokinase, partial [Burkholderiaceae bacterium]